MMNALKEKYQVRAANWLDIHAVVDLRNASSQNTRGTDSTAVHWQKRHWYDSGIDLAADSILVLEGETVAAYAEIISESPYIVHEMVGVVHPCFRGQGLGTYLVNWAENRVQQAEEKAPKEAAIFIQNSIFDSNQPGRDLLSTEGFTIVRDFVYFQIDMKQKPPDPTWSTGIEVRPLEPGDWDKVGPALHEAFEDHWGNITYETGESPENPDELTQDSRQTDPEAFDPAYFNSPGLCFVAWDGGQVAGSCLCNATTVEFPEAGYIGSLSIRRPWRQRGIGRALILQALNVFFDQGTRRVLTDTDGDSLTKAYNVYQKAGMKIFRREHVYEKMIRSGRDFVKRTSSNDVEQDIKDAR